MWMIIDGQQAGAQMVKAELARVFATVVLQVPTNSAIPSLNAVSASIVAFLTGFKRIPNAPRDGMS